MYYLALKLPHIFQNICMPIYSLIHLLPPIYDYASEVFFHNIESKSLPQVQIVQLQLNRLKNKHLQWYLSILWLLMALNTCISINQGNRIHSQQDHLPRTHLDLDGRPWWDRPWTGHDRDGLVSSVLDLEVPGLGAEVGYLHVLGDHFTVGYHLGEVGRPLQDQLWSTGDATRRQGG